VRSWGVLRWPLLGLLIALVGFDLIQVAFALVWAGRAAAPELLRALLTVGLPAALVLLAVALVALRRPALEIAELIDALRRLDPSGVPGDAGELAHLARIVAQLSEEHGRVSMSLVSERGRLEAVLGGMRDGVLALQRDGRVILANPAAHALLSSGRSPVGRTLYELTRSGGLVDLVSEAILGRAGTGEVDIRRISPDGGQPRVVRVLATATPQEGGGCVVVLRDITELRRLETARRDFIANVSHEIRTPVATIRASAEALAQGGLEDPEVASGFLGAILRHAERLGALVEDMLTLSRIEAGRFELAPEPLDLVVEVGAAVLAIEQRMQSRGQTLTTDVPEDLAVYADTRALEHVLTNLLGNAVKYTPEGGHLEIRAAPVPGGVRVEVRDDGPGIPPEHRERLFERFYRVDSGRSRELGGTGLGLAIVKHLVESMGGAVGMEPRLPAGSIFWVLLPAAPGSDPR